MRLEESSQLKNSSDLIGNRTGDLPAFRIVPQSTALQRVGKGLEGNIISVLKLVVTDKMCSV
jgi:hypothetical protein